MSSEPSPHHQEVNQHFRGGATSQKRCYLILSNPSKTTHLGTLLRCAAAFQVHQVLLVGYDKFNSQGSFGSHLFLDILAFPSWESVCDYLRRGGEEKGVADKNINSSECQKKHKINAGRQLISLVGILGSFEGGEEIYSHQGVEAYDDEGFVSLAPPEEKENKESRHEKQSSPSCLPQRSFPISSRPFSHDVCFILSKDGRGLPLSHARMCSSFVHVPQLPLFLDDNNEPKKPVGPVNSGDTTSKRAFQSPPERMPNSPTPKAPIKLSNLLDTATNLSIVLHHFTAWARYKERSFETNQKFVKDIKPKDRRRLCRIMDERNNDEIDSDIEQESHNAMALWNRTGPDFQSSDY
ncbi:hypothetical protein ACHAWF_008310 [Thalassiosira exigua]